MVATEEDPWTKVCCSFLKYYGNNLVKNQLGDWASLVLRSSLAAFFFPQPWHAFVKKLGGKAWV